MAERATAPTKKAARTARGKPVARQRSAGKAASEDKSKSASTAKSTQSLDGAVSRLEAEVAALRSERDTLSRDLKAARERIVTLETAHEQAVNRIDWVIDSLHNVLNEKA